MAEHTKPASRIMQRLRSLCVGGESIVEWKTGQYEKPSEARARPWCFPKQGATKIGTIHYTSRFQLLSLCPTSSCLPVVSCGRSGKESKNPLPQEMSSVESRFGPLERKRIEGSMFPP